MRDKNRFHGRDCDKNQDHGRNERPRYLELRTAVSLWRRALILSVAISEHDVDESAFDENEDDRAEQQQTIPEKIDLASQIRMRDERGVGMCFVAGDGHDGECGDQCVRCKPPEKWAVRTFHAQEILFSSFWERRHRYR